MLCQAAEQRWGSEYVRALGVFWSGQPRLPWRRLLPAVAGIALLVALLGLLGRADDHIALFLGFAPSCLLVFLLPEAPVSQPAAVIGGSVVSAVVGVIAAYTLPFTWWSAALAAAVATVAMAALRIIHPPAVAVAVIALSTGADWMFLLLPALAAPVLVVVTALVWHRLSGVRYPAPGMLGSGRVERHPRED
ncbi:HPP family protein [Leucobacter luti]|uniref:HPP family protein n=1 Tax=Leucobacter luti TaxID=340320 RepID=UPI001048D2CD|nr:HPP family protein [Leucobacter luti]MCW2289088.1 CBS-domain-containing membrane protein [Leucobacter luti]TCK35513.1 HPP family protein [Leucobacter luti]